MKKVAAVAVAAQVKALFFSHLRLKIALSGRTLKKIHCNQG
jgi:hypothetical protein